MPGPGDPTDPPASGLPEAWVWAAGACNPSPSASSPKRGCPILQGVRSPRRPPGSRVRCRCLVRGSCPLLHYATRGKGGWRARTGEVFHPTRNAKLRLAHKHRSAAGVGKSRSALPSLRTGRETLDSSGPPEKEMYCDSTVPFPSAPQWHQGQRPRLCALWSRTVLPPRSPSWQSFTMSRT